jgi:hypothetical protein
MALRYAAIVAVSSLMFGGSVFAHPRGGSACSGAPSAAGGAGSGHPQGNGSSNMTNASGGASGSTAASGSSTQSHPNQASSGNGNDRRGSESESNGAPLRRPVPIIMVNPWWTGNNTNMTSPGAGTSSPGNSTDTTSSPTTYLPSRESISVSDLNRPNIKHPLPRRQDSAVARAVQDLDFAIVRMKRSLRGRSDYDSAVMEKKAIQDQIISRREDGDATEADILQLALRALDAGKQITQIERETMAGTPDLAAVVARWQEVTSVGNTAVVAGR